MPYCKNNPKKTYIGTEPSPKGLGYCASSEKEGTVMKGKDGNQWIKKNGRWIKKPDDEYYKKELYKKIYKWWYNLSIGNFIIIYKDNTYKLIKSLKKTNMAKIKDLKEKWSEHSEDKDIKAIIWSAQSTDVIDSLIDKLIKKTSKTSLNKILEMKDIPSYLLLNYKKYFRKYELYSKKDYTI